MMHKKRNDLKGNNVKAFSSGSNCTSSQNVKQKCEIVKPDPTIPLLIFG
jgi:hypothetical protein